MDDQRYRVRKIPRLAITFELSVARTIVFNVIISDVDIVATPLELAWVFLPDPKTTLPSIFTPHSTRISLLAYFIGIVTFIVVRPARCLIVIVEPLNVLVKPNSLMEKTIGADVASR